VVVGERKKADFVVIIDEKKPFEKNLGMLWGSLRKGMFALESLWGFN